MCKTSNSPPSSKGVSPVKSSYNMQPIAHTSTLALYLMSIWVSALAYSYSVMGFFAAFFALSLTSRSGLAQSLIISGAMWSSEPTKSLIPGSLGSKRVANPQSASLALISPG